MTNNNFNKNNYDEVISSLSGKLSKDEVKNAAKSGDTSRLINSLSNDDKQKLNSILADKSKLEAVLNSPQAAAIFKMLSGGKKNG